MLRQSSRLTRQIPQCLPSRLGRGNTRLVSCRPRFSTQAARRQAGTRHYEPQDSLLKKMGESAATTFASIVVLALGFAGAGYIYHKSYKMLVLKKMTRAFEPGDPVLDLATTAKEVPRTIAPEDEHWVQRPEQAHVDRIVDGRESGHYYLFMGEKGTGKSSMLIEAMRKTDGDGVAMFEAHADTEIVRIRLGKALDYEFHEDYIGGYFSERGPRETTALLDIERALNKLEKVAMKLAQTRRKPLVLIVNQLHLLRNNDEGRDLLELLQQRAEQWAAANLVTMVFNTDDYWVYERLKLLATRMEVLAVTDLPKSQAINALRKYRQRYFHEIPNHKELEDVYDRIGGRLSFLNRVAKSRDMIRTCDQIKDTEKKWFLNQCWILGSEMDDDVMDQQKWAAAAMTLALALVDKEAEAPDSYDPVVGHLLPTFPFHIAQEIMTRADFIRDLDSLNLFTVTSQADVRASSVPMHLAFKEICAEPRFRKHLEDTIQRISDIESLGRTRELVAKDLVLGGQYDIETSRKGITPLPRKTNESHNIFHAQASQATAPRGFDSSSLASALMSANSKWPDFQLASKLRHFLGSSAPESTPSEPTTSQAKHEEPQASQEHDDERKGEVRTETMAELDNDPIEEMEDVGDYVDEGDAADVDVDFGDLEMFDSASQLPYSSQAPQNVKFDEPEFPTFTESAPNDKNTKKKSKDGRRASDFVVDDEAATAEDDRQASDAVEHPTSEMDALDLTPAQAADKKKKKRKQSDSVDGKRHKKRKGIEDGDSAVIEQTQDETAESADAGHTEAVTATSFLHTDKNATSQHVDAATEDDAANAEEQSSPSIARARRRSQTGEETRSRENSISSRAQFAPMAPMAIDTLPQEEAPPVDRDVEDLAREAWKEHISSQAGSHVNAPGDSAQAEEQPAASPAPRRSTRAKKAPVTLVQAADAKVETPAKKNRRVLEELPSPSANSPKPRARTKRATKRQPRTLQSLEEDGENGEDDEPSRRRGNAGGYTQGRFTDAELEAISRAVEAFRNEYGMTQVEVNEIIQAPGGTTAGDAHARLWYRLFEVCPDRKRQKVINIARKKFHNFVARGTWTPEQDAELASLIEVHKSAWSKIAGIINRHPEDVRDRYRNYIVCGANQRKDVWSEEEEAHLTQIVKDAMVAIDDLRLASPDKPLLKKPYEELIDWQDISEQMGRTRSRLQCITKWKAMQMRLSGKKKDKKSGSSSQGSEKKKQQPSQAEPSVSNEDLAFQLDVARQQLASMREEEQYRLVLAIQGASVLSEDQIPWTKLLDKKFRRQWTRGTQALLWDRLKQTVTDWESMTVLDIAQQLINEYNRTGGLPEVTGSGYDDDDREREILRQLNARHKPAAAPKSEEFVHDSGAEDAKEDEQPNQNDKLDITIDPALMEAAPPSPPKATPKPKKAAPRKTPAKKKSKKQDLSQDPIEDSEPTLPVATVDQGEESNLEEAQARKAKTPSKFKSVNTSGNEENGVDAPQTEPYSDSVMDDMEDLPARVST
ncbi:hypothetical protein BBK36DRAFT_1192846 [Trichoderma citrinoviride]|uniref:P-loop containing nucleoside triphosphate hydrolase protein n=1 Tax=Trichoderma citrinoviride TaxID=58853 RepID=A0A2T4BIA4_9HYPO|nr:hypothetical protein BBK36DRAFT_1192846 [Trichoderma citrinoviride]PTB69030.1 hypothetical protein BBK36DRAFT_1192846 [Trichoderma citrinoviride]